MDKGLHMRYDLDDAEPLETCRDWRSALVDGWLGCIYFWNIRIVMSSRLSTSSPSEVNMASPESHLKVCSCRYIILKSTSSHVLATLNMVSSAFPSCWNWSCPIRRSERLMTLWSGVAHVLMIGWPVELPVTNKEPGAGLRLRMQVAKLPTGGMAMPWIFVPCIPRIDEVT